MKDNSQNKPRRKRAQKKPDGLQWQLDQELQEKLARQENLSLEERLRLEDRLRAILSPDVDNFLDLLTGEGYPDLLSPVKQEIETPTPPAPPPLKPCLYEHPATRETIRRRLKELAVTNINQLIRTYQAAELIEAISDYERAVSDGLRVRSPTAYFRSLLK